MKKHRIMSLIALLLVGGLLLAACDDGGTEGEAEDTQTDTGTDAGTDAESTPAAQEDTGTEGDAAGDDNPEGRTIRIAFSAPGADHGWLAAITENARAEADRHGDVELILLEGTNDSATQVTQVEQLIAEQPDVLVILPHEGDALTPIAQEVMNSGIPVVNVDRAFSDQSAYRTWIGGDNYGIGWSAGNYFADELSCEGNVVEIQGLAGISVTEERTQGFADAIEQRCDGGIEIVAQQPADFVPDRGLQVMETILQAESEIDAVYTHDDDMAEGVVAAIENAGREGEMFLTGAGGSGAAFDRIAEGGLYRATFLYNPSMSASAVRIARLIALDQGFDELAEPEVPSYIELAATTVTADNVEDVRDLGF